MKTLQQARKDAGLTQDQVCEEIGMTQGSLSQLESGQRLPTWERVRQFCQLYEIHPTELSVSMSNYKRPKKKETAVNIKRADALRFALSQIVSKEHVDKVIEISAAIIEVERN
jgi:transcriptional regulator with XRE-family HTH domain